MDIFLADGLTIGGGGVGNTSTLPTRLGFWACGAPAGYDRCVNRIRWQVQNPLSYSAPNDTGTLQFVAQIR